MEITGTSIVVTGAGNGIGAALAIEFAGHAPAGIAVFDIDGAAAEKTADRIRSLGVPACALTVDVCDPAQVADAFDRVSRVYGTPGIVCSNAGVGTGQGLFAGPELWEAAWSTNVLSHVHVARVAMPLMVRRGEGHLMITASAAGLLGLAGDAPYSVTKRAAVALAEWLAIAYGGRGVDISALCPLGVRTDLLVPALAARHRAAVEIESLAPIIEAEDVARVAAEAIADGRFLVLPHPEVAELQRTKDADPEAWIESRRPVRRAVAVAAVS